MTAMTKLLTLFLLLLLAAGCATTYVPVSWGDGDRVQKMSHSDVTLGTLFGRFDPERTTLRMDGESFDEVMMPSEVKYHLGAYRPDTKLIYRNLYRKYSDLEMRDLLVHEFAHHIWFTHMSKRQQELWRIYLVMNPTPLQTMVRTTYPQATDWDTEDFAFTIQYARPADIEELVKLDVISAEDGEKILKILPQVRHAIPPPEESSATSGPDPYASLPEMSGAAKPAK